MFHNCFLDKEFSYDEKKSDANQRTSSGNVLAIFLNTSGANLLTRSEYSPINQRIDARAAGTVTLSTIRTICLIISLYCSGYSTKQSNVDQKEQRKSSNFVLTLICNSFLITTTLSATMVSSFFDMSATNPFKQASVTSGILLAHRPMA